MSDRDLAQARDHITAGRWAEAIRALTLAVDGPSGRDALIMLSQVFRRLDRTEHAVQALETALARDPDDREAKFQLANLASEIGAGEGAERIYRELLADDLESLPVRNNLANLLRAMHRPEEALQVIDGGMSQGRENATALSTYGLCAMDCGDLDGARLAYERALRLEPGHGRARANLGELLLLVGDTAAGIAELEAARRLLEAPAQVDVNLAYARFLEGEYRAGWQAFESRFSVQGPTERPARPFGQQRWQGQQLDGTLLVWGEQGIGEEIVFATMLAEARRRAKHLVLECDPRLVPLFARSLADVEVVPRSDPPAARLSAPDVLAQIPLASLGGIFRNRPEEFPPQPGHLRADPALQAELRSRYRAMGEGPLVGLSWRSVNARAGPAKSMALTDLSKLATARPAVFVNLQYGEVDAEIAALQAATGVRVIRDSAVDQMQDMDAFAAQVAALDLVITISNTAAHVAGALGRPTWTMVPAGPGLRWYWGRSGNRSPWYDSLRLFRQGVPGHWHGVIEEVGAAFRQLPAAGAGADGT